MQLYATGEFSDFTPDTVKGDRLRETKDILASCGIEVSALCGDLGGHGFQIPADNVWKIEKSKRIIDLALELGANVVTTHIGVVPASEEHPRFRILQDACGELAAYADTLGAHFAIETGPETSLVLKGFLDSLHSTGVAVNLDPANLVMVTGDDPVKAVHNLKDYIVHTHAKDGRKLDNRDSEVIYGLRPGDPLVTNPAFIELALGDGDVPFPAYLKALEEIGYKGFLTIEREVGDNPTADIEKAVRFLRGMM